MKAVHAPTPPEIRGYIHNPEMGEYYTHASTLGRSAVIADNLRTEAMFLHDDVQQGIAWLDTYVNPGKQFRLNMLQRAHVKRYSMDRLQGLATSYEDMAESYTADAEAALSQARAFFLTIEPERTKRAETVLANMGIRHSIFGNWKRRIDPTGELSWSQTLGRHFSDEQLMNFLQANVNETALAQAELDEQLPRQIRHYKARVTHAVESGILPETALNNLDKIDDIQFFAGDLFDTLSRETLGYFCANDNLNRGVVVVAAETLLLPGKTTRVLTHEMTHVIAGSNGAKRGLRFGNSNIWLDEAMTEHITQTLIGAKDFDDPYPYQNDKHGTLVARGSYIEERNLLSVLREVISLNELATMYFDPDHAPLTKTLATMVALVGADTYKQLLAKYNRSSERVDQKAVMRSLAIKAGTAIVRSRLIGASFTDSNQI